MSNLAWKDRKKSVNVLGRTMTYVEQGEGPVTVLLLHGNPTSSYLWRNVAAQLEGVARCIMPDLIGMGDSERLPVDDEGRYTFVDHRRYFDGFVQALGLNDVIVVCHDWGSALGFDWAYRVPGAVRAICYMEAIVTELAWDDWPENVRPVFQGFRTPGVGESMILEQNLFVEAVLPGATVGGISEEDMAEYRRPYLTPGEDRRPTLTWPRQLPIAGEPSDVIKIVKQYGAWLAATPGLPKLFVNAEPGAILIGQQREFCRTWPDQEEITVTGVHFVQEDSGKEIGVAIRDWLARIS